MSPRVGLYPGSFDPVHVGHVDLVHRASRITDRLVVAVLVNPAKTCRFTVEERVDLLEEVFADHDDVEIATFDGLLVDFAKQVGANVVVRGLRAVSDFDYEFSMAHMNRRLQPEIETVCLMAAPDYTYLSSRLVKEVAGLGGDVANLVPPTVLRALQAG
ncbi:MAG: pantetheine-phosphate adenylyltransferase [Acidobacteriota bacterium]